MRSTSAVLCVLALIGVASARSLGPSYSHIASGSYAGGKAISYSSTVQHDSIGQHGNHDVDGSSQGGYDHSGPSYSHVDSGSFGHSEEGLGYSHGDSGSYGQSEEGLGYTDGDSGSYGHSEEGPSYSHVASGSFAGGKAISYSSSVQHDKAGQYGTVNFGPEAGFGGSLEGSSKPEDIHVGQNHVLDLNLGHYAHEESSSNSGGLGHASSGYKSPLDGQSAGLAYHHIGGGSFTEGKASS